MIKAGFAAVSILALWLGIEEYAEVKATTHDGCLAILRMMFIVASVYGISYILLITGSYIIPMLKAKVSGSLHPEADSGFSKEQFDDLCAKETKKKLENHNDLMKSLTDYTSFTFGKLVNTEQLDIILENIRLMADGKDATGNVNRRMAGVTSNDLYHFGWNIGKRLKRTNIQIAWFLKDTFKAMLDDVSVDTVQTKLANKEGNYTLKLIPLDQELVPHIFPVCA